MAGELAAVLPGEKVSGGSVGGAAEVVWERRHGSGKEADTRCGRGRGGSGQGCAPVDGEIARALMSGG